MKRNSKFHRVSRRLTLACGRANVGYILNIGGIKPQTDYSPQDPEKYRIRPLDSSPDAVKEREKAARNSLIIPLAVILSVVIFFIVFCLVKG